jgi:hypothetical protein
VNTLHKGDDDDDDDDDDDKHYVPHLRRGLCKNRLLLHIRILGETQRNRICIHTLHTAQTWTLSQYILRLGLGMAGDRVRWTAEV